ncbi:C40 family peptidase [Aridibaculum aurantiacum]|uniref:C40 family peptidase n=1 Tax=Aridibaculum aurantiacum TaxID=2810307 RepID=UPI001A96215C|nr:C40 family peptidase [Aridibaculum aurantiacum]
MKLLVSIFLLFLLSCNQQEEPRIAITDTFDTTPSEDTIKEDLYIPDEKTIRTGNTTPAEVVEFAKTLIGTPYQYASNDPAKGFDCSGFIHYVFSHFHIQVPRSSVGFTNVEYEVPLADAKPGDLILFTGTDSSVHEVGHMGLITSGGTEKAFIHSTSGKAHGVTITPLNDYYMSRFVKVIRIFKQNDSL